MEVIYSTITEVSMILQVGVVGIDMGGKAEVNNGEDTEGNT